MTDTLVIPDAVLLVSAYLRPLIDPLPIKPNMGSSPNAKALARIRVTRIGGVPDPSGPLWVDRPRLRFESWGPTQPADGDGMVEANANAEKCRRLLRPELFCGRHATGVVNNVIFESFMENPDDSWGGDVARARTSFDVTVYLHPLPT